MWKTKLGGGAVPSPTPITLVPSPRVTVMESAVYATVAHKVDLVYGSVKLIGVWNFADHQQFHQPRPNKRLLFTADSTQSTPCGVFIFDSAWWDYRMSAKCPNACCLWLLTITTRRLTKHVLWASCMYWKFCDKAADCLWLILFVCCCFTCS